jgi:hypothetical protein
LLRLFVCTADADPEAEPLEIANSIEPVEDGRIHVP